MMADTLYLMDLLKNYSSPKSKISTMVKSGQLTRIKRGIYVRNNDYDKKVLANIIYGPSYISFEYALSWYGMIPERVQAVTSAVYNKNKDKVFDTPAGTFIYKYTNPEVYFHGIIWNTDHGEPFLIATKEKALCDTLYKIKRIGDKTDIERVLYEDLRIDDESLKTLNRKDIAYLSGIYRRTYIYELSNFLLKRGI